MKVTDNLMNYLSILHFMFLNTVSEMALTQQTGDVAYSDSKCEVFKNFHEIIADQLREEQNQLLNDQLMELDNDEGD